MRKFKLASRLILAAALAGSFAACRATVEDSNAPHSVPFDAARVDNTVFGGALPIDDTAITKVDSSKLIADLAPCRKPTLAKVFAIADGDTIDVDEVGADGSAGLRVRLIGVNSPEISHDGGVAECFGDDATTFTRQLIGHYVWLTFGSTCTDKYDRTLAYVHLSATETGFFQRQLLRRGYAKAYIFDDNDAERALFEADQALAKTEKAGLWGKCESN